MAGLLDFLQMLQGQQGGGPGAPAGLLGLLQAGINPNDQTTDMGGYTPGQTQPGMLNQMGQAFNGLMPQSSLYPGDREAARANLDPGSAYAAPPGLLDRLMPQRPGAGSAGPMMPQGGPQTFQPPMGGQGAPQSPMVPPGDMNGYSQAQASPMAGAMAQMPQRALPPQSAPPLPPPTNVAALPPPGAPQGMPPNGMDARGVSGAGPVLDAARKQQPPPPAVPPSMLPPAPAPDPYAGQARGPVVGLMDNIGLGGILGSKGGLLGGLQNSYGGPDAMRTMLSGLQGHDTSQHMFDRALKTRHQQFLEDQAKDKPSVQKITDVMGNDRLVRILPNGQSEYLNPTGGGSDKPNNPYSTGAKTTESQSKDQGYASRLFNSEKVLRETEATGTDLQQQGMAKIPIAGNYLVSKDYQKFDQAQRDFINANLRRESGAAIHESEFANARKQYLPQPGDSQEVLAQKRQNRQAAIEGIAGGGGPNYQPPATFGPKGELIDRPRQQPGQQQAAPQQQPGTLPPGVNKQQAVAEAQRAMAAAKTPEQKAAIMQRLKSWGI